MTNRQKQNLLQYLGYYLAVPDGIWGEKSLTATRNFQQAWGLPASGVFDKQTEAKVRQVIGEGREPEPPDWWQEVPHFRRAEFRCPCGRCGGFPVEPQESMVRTVDEIRRRLGVPVSVVDGGGSGVRCAAHNAEVGGVANSQHLYGLAADLHSAASPAEMKAAAEEVLGHTGGIGLYGWGIHVDTRQGYARWKG